MEQSLILALDIGSSSVRASLYDSDANPVPGTFVKIERSFVSTADGGSELDSHAAFAQVVAAIDSVLEKSGQIKGEINHVASCAFWHSLVGVDADGDPMPTVLGWADTRSRDYTKILQNEFDEAEVHNRCGAHFHSSYWPAKLMWLRNEFPDAFANAGGIYSFSDFVALKFFGEAATSISMASGTGLFDIRRCVWDEELLNFLKIDPALLPRIADDKSETLTLGQTFAKRWPRLAHAKWFPTIGDGAADNIGSGCVTRSKAALMVGTSGAMRVAYRGEPPTNIPEGLWCYRIDAASVIIGGALSDGGNLYRWLKDNLKLPNDAEAQIQERGAARHGLTFLPFLFGERSIGYDEAAVGGLIHLTASHDSVDILQAAMESVAFRFAEVFDRLKPVTNISQIVASGGALRDSALWMQIIADVLGHDLTPAIVHESSLSGAVLLALQTTGKIENIECVSVRKDSPVSYRPERYVVCLQARDTHRKRYNDLKGIYDSRRQS